MVLLFIILIAAILSLFVYLASSIEPQTKPDEIDPVFEKLFHFIDTSLKGYPDRNHFKDFYHNHTWTCHSRLFTFQIQLKKETLRYQFQIFFFVELPFKFKIQRSLTGQTMTIIQSSGEITKRLIAQKELPALIQRLQFYDSLKISSTSVGGTKTFQSLEDLKEWPKTLGASITFLRFLLNYQDRKESTEKGDAVCPYCRNPIIETEKSVSCRECRTIHHWDCWNETDRCSVFGCRSKSELEL